MTTKTIKKLSQKGSVELVGEICDGLKEFFASNPQGVKEFLVPLVENVLEPLACEDYFGTEGWEHGLGVED